MKRSKRSDRREEKPAQPLTVDQVSTAIRATNASHEMVSELNRLTVGKGSLYSFSPDASDAANDAISALIRLRICVETAANKARWSAPKSSEQARS